MTDLRKDKRAPASLKVKYKSGTVDEFVEQFGTDVSLGGIFVKTKKPIEIGALLKLELQLNDASPVIHGVGRVCWRREQTADPNLPSGMGIKFIKLDPDSRTVVDRIVQTRGHGPSRFDLTQGAEIAPPSTPPTAIDAPSTPAPRSLPAAPTPPKPKAVPLAAVKPVQAAVPRAALSAAASAPPAGRPSPFSSPAAKAAFAPQPRRSSNPGGAAMAGLFADSPLTQSSSPEPLPSSSRTSFFPPAPEPFAAHTAASEPARASFASAAAFEAPGSSPGMRAALGKPAPRAERSRQSGGSGAFLATAFAEGGVPPLPAPKGVLARPANGEDAAIDALFDDVMDGPNAAAADVAMLPPQPAAVADVEDMFAALSEEEGLSNPPAQRASQPTPSAFERKSQPGLRSAPSNDSVDELFAELSESQRPARRAPAAARSVAVADAAAEDDLALDQEGSLEEDLQQATTSIPPGAWPSQPPRLSSTPPPQSALEGGSKSRVAIAFGLVVVLGVAGFYFYRQATLARQVAEAAAVTAGEPVAATGSAAGAAVPGQPSAHPAQRAEPAGPAVEVEITSVPRGADVQIDGKAAGVTPLRLALASSREAQVRVSSPGYTAMTKPVTPAAGADPLRFRLEPLPFEVSVRADPSDAEISLGDRTAIAPGPLALGHLDGAVQVSIAKDGYQRMTRPLRLDEFTEVGGVMRANIEVRLSPLPGAEAESSRLRRRGASPRLPDLPAPSPEPSPGSGPQLSVTPAAPAATAAPPPPPAPAAAPAAAAPAPAPSAPEPPSP